MMNDEKEREIKTVWEGLGIERTRDLEIIKGAFLVCSEKINVEEQADEFMLLKTFYRYACAHAVDDERFPLPDSEEETDFSEEKEEKSRITYETLLTQTQKETEFLLKRFGSAFLKRARKNGRLRKFFKSKEYVTYSENREFIEIFTDYLCYYADGREFCKTLTLELDRLQDRLGDNLYIYKNIKYIKKQQLRFKKPISMLYIICSVFLPILMFTILSLFIGIQMIFIMVLIYAPPLLVFLLYKIVFKYS